MNYKSILSIFIVALGVLGCSGKRHNAHQSTYLTVGVMSSMDYLPLAVAQRNGYFTQEGISVYFQKFYSANERDAALQSGNLDGCILDYTGGAIQHAAGEAIFFTSQCDGVFELIANKHLQISSIADLRNKNIATARNTVVDFYADMILRSAQIDAGEIQKSEINKIPLRLEMLRNGKIDLTVLPDPFASIAKADGHRAIKLPKELNLNVTGIVFTQAAIENKTDAIHAFYRAYNTAINELTHRPLDDFYQILTEEIGFPESIKLGIQLPNYQVASLPSVNDLDAVSKWLKAKQLIPRNYDIQSMIVSKFATNE